MPAVTADEIALQKIRAGAPCHLPSYGAAQLVRVFDGRGDLVGVCRRIAGPLFRVKVNLIGR